MEGIREKIGDKWARDGRENDVKIKNTSTKK